MNHLYADMILIKRNIQHYFSARLTGLFFTLLLMQITACTANSTTATLADSAIPSLDKNSIIPKPVLVNAQQGIFRLARSTTVYVDRGAAKDIAVAKYLVDTLNPATGFKLKVIETSRKPPKGSIYLRSNQASTLGEEGYRLQIQSSGINLSAKTPTGLFRGVQSIRQLLSADIEADEKQAGPWLIPNGEIVDYPRLAYRGFMLDVAREFHSVETVKALIDQMALYKFSVFHIHLTDDQGWRIEIPAWPKLTTIGSQSAVKKNRCDGCFYTLEEFEEIVAYAEARHIMVVPEIDTPGHVRAAMASYPDELYCDGDKPEWPYTGVKVKISSLCFKNPQIYRFFEDVIAEIAPRINGPYIHIGGDETPDWVDWSDYETFILKARDIIAEHDKIMVGWTNDVGSVKTVGPDVIGHHWSRPEKCCETTLSIVNQGGKIIMSPAHKAYVSLKYNESTPYGGSFAGFVNVQTVYDWDPATIVEGVEEHSVLGVEAALWGEWARGIDEAEFLIFPRLLGLAEVGWTPQSARQWQEYRKRLAKHGPRLRKLGIDFYASPLVDWE